jgi:hypothetical protein
LSIPLAVPASIDRWGSDRIGDSAYLFSRLAVEQEGLHDILGVLLFPTMFGVGRALWGPYVGRLGDLNLGGNCDGRAFHLLPLDEWQHR